MERENTLIGTIYVLLLISRLCLALSSFLSAVSSVLTFVYLSVPT
jgi:hypothetical protein